MSQYRLHPAAILPIIGLGTLGYTVYSRRAARSPPVYQGKGLLQGLPDPATARHYARHIDMAVASQYVHYPDHSIMAAAQADFSQQRRHRLLSEQLAEIDRRATASGPEGMVGRTELIDKVHSLLASPGLVCLHSQPADPVLAQLTTQGVLEVDLSAWQGDAYEGLYKAILTALGIPDEGSQPHPQGVQGVQGVQAQGGWSRGYLPADITDTQSYSQRLAKLLLRLPDVLKTSTPGLIIHRAEALFPSASEPALIQLLQQKKLSVLLVSSNPLLPLWVLGADAKVTVLSAGELPPVDMAQLLASWRTGHHLSMALMDHCGGAPNDCKQILHALAHEEGFEGGLYAAGKQIDLTMKHTPAMAQLLKQLVVHGFAPIDPKDPIAQAICEAHLGVLVQRGSLAVGLPDAVWKETKADYGLVPYKQSIRLVFADYLHAEGGRGGGGGDKDDPCLHLGDQP